MYVVPDSPRPNTNSLSYFKDYDHFPLNLLSRLEGHHCTAKMADRRGCARNLLVILRNLVLAVVLYGGILTVIELARTGSVNALARVRPPHLRSQTPAQDSPGAGSGGGTSDGQIEVGVGGSREKIVINHPHANVFNRPHSLVVAKDDYLGPRPHVDTVANLPLIVEQCRGSLEGLEKMRYPFECLQFLAKNEEDYYFMPPEGKRASEQDPQQSEYALPASHDHSLTRYVSPLEATAASNVSIGTCAGPVIPYHAYWTGPATWRVEVFIKSYLYTQRLPCSRLWLWLDVDRHPTAVEDLLERDPVFARFRPLVERGDIVLKAWKFPSRIPLPGKVDHHTDEVGYYKTPGAPNAEGERMVGDGVMEDAEGRQWIVITPKQMTFLPVAVSDAVRFVVLHLYGGLYLDVDVVLLRDMRPLLLPDPATGQHSFAERWGAHPSPADYNSAIMSLTANSSLSSYLLRGGVRMGLNFHPLVIGQMAWRDGRNTELLKLETATVDPIWTEFQSLRLGKCTVPCLTDYGRAFRGTANAIPGEWQSYEGEPAVPAPGLQHRRRDVLLRRRKLRTIRDSEFSSSSSLKSSSSNSNEREEDDERTNDSADDHHPSALEAQLRAEGAIKEYLLEEDQYPPTNRTLENFFRGAWTYHIHNQVRSFFPFPPFPPLFFL